MFENEPALVVALPKKATKIKNTKRRKNGAGRQTNLFGSVNFNENGVSRNATTNGKKQEVIGDLFSNNQGNNQTIQSTIPEPAPYSGELKSFHRDDCLVVDNGWVGHLQEVNTSNGYAVFHPLQLSSTQRVRAEAYIGVRDVYQQLYLTEAELQTEHHQERETLNRLYDAFVKRYGNLNSAENIKLIKTDSAGKEMPYLERVIGGVVHKADIFKHPVSFSTLDIATDNPEEALAASLNKFGKVDLDYMSEISGIPTDTLKEALHGRIYYNPLQKEYEIAERWIAGNVVEKAQAVKDYLENNPDDTQAKESLTVLEEARPRRIEFEELDFNLGERWIPTGIYARFASHLFDAEVRIHYSNSADDFSVTCKQKNVHIWDKYAVKAQSRTYDGIALLKHALVNTTPDISKTVQVDGKYQD